jgi:hypothetical protein
MVTDKKLFLYVSSVCFFIAILISLAVYLFNPSSSLVIFVLDIILTVSCLSFFCYYVIPVRKHTKLIVISYFFLVLCFYILFNTFIVNYFTEYSLLRQNLFMTWGMSFIVFFPGFLLISIAKHNYKT